MIDKGKKVVAAVGFAGLLMLSMAGGGIGCAATRPQERGMGPAAAGGGGAGSLSLDESGADPSDVARIVALVSKAENQFAAETAERQAMRTVLQQLAGFNGLPLIQRNISYVAADTGLAGARILPGPVKDGELVSESTVSVEGIANMASVAAFVKELSSMQPQVRVNAVQLDTGLGGKEPIHVRVTLTVLMRGELPPAVILPPQEDVAGGNSMHSAATMEAMRARANLVQQALKNGREETAILQKGIDVVNEGRIDATCIMERVEQVFSGVSVAGLLQMRINGTDQEFKLLGFARNEHAVEAAFARLAVDLGQFVTDLRVVNVEADRLPELGLTRVFTVQGNVVLDKVPITPIRRPGVRPSVGGSMSKPGSPMVSDEQPSLPL